MRMFHLQGCESGLKKIISIPFGGTLMMKENNMSNYKGYGMLVVVDWLEITDHKSILVPVFLL